MRTTCAALLALSLLACSTPPDERCRSLVEASCDAIFSCTPPEDQDAAFIDLYGADATACAIKTAEGLACAQWIDNGYCANGLKLQSDQLDECAEAWSDPSCPEVRAGIVPPSCSQICVVDTSAPPIPETCNRTGGDTICESGTAEACDGACEEWTGTQCCVRHAEVCTSGADAECVGPGQAWTGARCCILAD